VSYQGGSSTVTVNQRVNGGQWVLLGTYPFNAAGSGYKVDLADTSASGKVVADAIYYVQDGAPVDSFTWTPDIQSAGDYQLYARWTASSANSGAAQYTVVHGGGTSLVTVSQKQNGGQWNLLGTWSFAPGAGHQVTLTASSDGNVVADAIKLVGTGPAPANLVYLHSDQIGLPQKITDATQAVVWDRVQDPFGRQVSLTNSGGIDTALRFPGQQADPDTGFAYNYFRDYDPTLGRYIQSDPIGLAGGINRYAYVGGNPVGRTDSNGQVIDTIADVAFVSYDLYRLWSDNIAGSCDNLGENAFALGADVVGALIPFATGLGIGVRSVEHVVPFQVGRFDELQRLSSVGDDLALHHVGQSHAMGQLIPKYERRTAPAIAVPEAQHRAIPNLTGPYAGTARNLLARDIRNLRNYTDAPNSSLLELIQLNKELYPEAFAK